MKLITDMTLDMEITEMTWDRIRIRIGNGNVNGYGPRKIVSKDIGYVSSVHWYRRPYKRVKRLRYSMR